VVAGLRLRVAHKESASAPGADGWGLLAPVRASHWPVGLSPGMDQALALAGAGRQ
jgi:hypothetical protein